MKKSFGEKMCDLVFLLFNALYCFGLAWITAGAIFDLCEIVPTEENLLSRLLVTFGITTVYLGLSIIVSYIKGIKDKLEKIEEKLNTKTL
jgi:hypothetical protein